MDPNARYYGAAANYNKPGGPVFNRRFLVLIGALLVVILLLFVAFAIFNSFTSAPKERLATLVAREQSLQAFTSSNQSKLTSDHLQKVNSETHLYTTSDGASLKRQLSLRYGLSEIPKEITAAEADDSTKKLNEATQSGKFNEVYKEILNQKLVATQQLAESVQQGTKGQLNAALEKAIQNLVALQEQLATAH
ncbi:MAG TPA: hypothetical protein VFT87_01360 [Candidatus Saccharimonadales bacterium]|nr:hypothetical protein [Candidatus Saccharimonadales bacterium]